MVTARKLPTSVAENRMRWPVVSSLVMKPPAMAE
jgi:hypothetical protein